MRSLVPVQYDSRKAFAPTGFLIVSLFAIGAFAQEYTIRTLATDATGTGVAIDAAGNVYYPSFFGRQITRLSPDGRRSIFAGRVFGAGYSLGDGGRATDATFSMATALTTDSAGNLYVYDDRVIRKIDRNGIISTVAGSGAPVPTTAVGSGIPATALQLHVQVSSGIAADGAGNLWVACSGYPALFRIAGGIASIFAGLGGQDLGATPPAGYSGDGGPARAALLSLPNDVAIDGRGNLWILDAERIRQIDPTGVIRTIAGPPALRTFSPLGVAADGSGNVFVADSGGGRILRIAAGGAITTVAGGGTHGEDGYEGPATGALLSFPKQMAVDAAGNLYFASQHDATVRKLTPVPVPAIAAGGIVHAASLQTGPLAPGTIIRISGANLQGGRVLIGGTNAAVLSGTNTEIRAVIPLDAALGSADVVVQVETRRSAAQRIVLVESAPALFSLDGSGKGQGAILNSDTALNSPARPAAPGDSVVLFGTGAGRALADAFEVTIGGNAARVIYAGPAPGEAAGVFQVNAEVPVQAAPGSLPVVVKVGAASSPATVTLAVR